MPRLSYKDIRLLDQVLGMESGYVLDFSNRTIRDFFQDEFSIDIYCDKYAVDGDSKGKRLRALIKVEDGMFVSAVLRKLWDHKLAIPRTPFASSQQNEVSQEQKDAYFEIINKLENSSELPNMDGITQFERDQTLEELILAIERDVNANKPSAALDRLHTYCMKKFAYLLNVKGISFLKEEPLHSRVGKYAKEVTRERDLHDITNTIIKSSISIFQKFNDVRNHRSFAHDNEIIMPLEARFIFDSVVAILRFIKSLESEIYEQV